MFDADAFLQTEVTGALDTRLIPVPEGDFLGQCTEVKPRQITTKNGDERVLVDLTWEVLSDEAKKATGRDKPTVRQTIFLDLTDEGGLDFSKGKNIQLGRVREAVGQNDPKRKWSMMMLMNTQATLLIGHRADENDPETVYAEVKKITKAK